MRRSVRHPGDVLREYMTPIGITQVELAKHLGMSFQRLNEILNGRRGVTVDTALLLAQAFRTTPEFWLDLQRDWDLQTYPYEVKRVSALR